MNAHAVEAVRAEGVHIVETVIGIQRIIDMADLEAHDIGCAGIIGMLIDHIAGEIIHRRRIQRADRQSLIGI